MSWHLEERWNSFSYDWSKTFLDGFHFIFLPEKKTKGLPTLMWVNPIWKHLVWPHLCSVLEWSCATPVIWPECASMHAFRAVGVGWGFSGVFWAPESFANQKVCFLPLCCHSADFFFPSSTEKLKAESVANVWTCMRRLKKDKNQDVGPSSFNYKNTLRK